MQARRKCDVAQVCDLMQCSLKIAGNIFLEGGGELWTYVDGVYKVLFPFAALTMKLLKKVHSIYR